MSSNTEEATRVAVEQVAKLIAEVMNSSFKTVLNTIGDTLNAALKDNFEDTTVPIARALASMDEEKQKLQQNAGEIENHAAKFTTLERSSSELFQETNRLGPTAREVTNALVTPKPGQGA